MQSLVSPPPASPIRFTFRAMLIAIVIFAGVAPTLSWLEFSSGSENLVVGTILSMRQGGPWVVPDLNGLPRTSKPPLVNWISASIVRPSTVASLSDPAQRDEAYRELSWEVRAPALGFACFALVAGAWLGRIILGDSAGLVTALMMGTSVMFLRFGRSMSTDVHLTLWVTTANAFFALALLDRRRRWIGCVFGGLALGLALMSKGPPAIAQTVAPIAVFVLWRWWTGRVTPETRVGWMPAIVAALATLLIALPWPILVLSRMSGQLAFWWREVTQGGNTDYRPDPAYVYLALIPLLLPWVGFFFLGLVLLIREKTERGILVVFLLITPIVVMCFFKEKNDRYLLPMLAPAALVCATGFLGRGREIDPARRVIAGITWGILGAIALGLPIAGVFVERIGGGSWWPKSSAAILVAAGFGFVTLTWFFDRDGRRSLVPVAVIIMLAAQGLFMYGYCDSPRGRSDGRPIADAVCAALPPDAEVWSYYEPGRFSRVPIDMAIYLNRVVRQATTPTTLPTTTKTRAMLVHFRKDEKLPPGLEQWKQIGTTEKNEGVWRAYAEPTAETP